jgi:thiamine-phosphate pyrophosphorylase
MKQRPDLRLYLVTDRALCGRRSLEDVVQAAVRGGVTAVQLREKECTARESVALARTLKSLLAPRGVPLLINDRVDVALAAGADGVHVGQSDMPAADARRLMGPQAIIGLSVENIEQVVEAETLDVDYLAVSPVFATPTKTDTAPAWGLEGLRKVRAASRHLLVAIGGINAANGAQVLEAGTDSLAVVSAICAASDPEAAAAELRRIVNASTAGPRSRCGRSAGTDRPL